jgi:hypothetical protein
VMFLALSKTLLHPHASIRASGLEVRSTLALETLPPLMYSQ